MLNLFKISIIVLFLSIFSLQAYAYPKDCIVINIPSRTLDLYKNGKVINTYPVGVGRPGFPTPIGIFKVIRKLEQPGWENPYLPDGHTRINSGQDNPLGTRWIGFKFDSKGEYGIHGSYNRESIGKFSSHGCVRMKVEEAEKLYQNVKVGMPVIVTYDTTRVILSGTDVFLQSFPDVYKLGKSSIYKLKENITNLNKIIFWDASIALKVIKEESKDKVKIGTVIDDEIYTK